MIAVEALGFRYGPGLPWTFRQHSFSVGRGKVMAVLGPNGRGKTTLLKTLLALHRPTEGLAHLAGPVGYVPQSSECPFAYTVFDVVLMGRARHIGALGSPGREDHAAARSAMARLNIERLASRKVTTLSGGERQLVLLARALASDCSILVLDEPTSALDFRNQQVMLQTMADLAHTDGMTILFTTHTPHHAVLLADEVLLMHGPEQYDVGPAREILNEDRLSDLYGIAIRHLNFDHEGRPAQAMVPVLTAG